MLIFIVYVFIGAIAGTLAGLLGVGGAILIVPALVFVFSSQHIVPASQLMHYIVGTSLAATFVTTLFSLRAQIRYGNFSWPLFNKLWPGIAIGTIGGTFLASLANTHSLRIFFGVFMILVSLQTFFRLRESVKEGIPRSLFRWIATLLIGVFAGLLGISGGALTIPYLTYYQTPIRQAMAASTACGIVIAMVGTISFIVLGLHQANAPAWTTGFIYWPAVLGIALGSPWCAALGAAWSSRLPVLTLRRVFAAFLFIVGINMLFRF